MQDKDMLEKTDEIKDGNHRVPPLVWVLMAVLVTICVAYFFTHLTRPV